MAKLILDEATRQKMARIVPFHCGAAPAWTPEEYNNDDIPEDGRPRFYVRVLTNGESSTINRCLIEQTDSGVDEVIRILRSAVVRWERLYDLSTGEEIPFVADPAGGVSVEAWNRLPNGIVKRILRRATDTTHLEPEARVGLTSSPPPTQE